MKAAIIKQNAIQVPESTSHSAGSLGISIVNTEENGKRIRMSSGLFRNLGEPAYVGIYTDDNGVYIFPQESGLKVSKSANIYNTSAVNMVTEAFNLDFKGKSSLSFSATVEKAEDTSEKFGFIKMN